MNEYDGMGHYIFLCIYPCVHAFTVYCEGIAECQVSCYTNCRADLGKKMARFFLHQGHTTEPVAKILHVWRGYCDKT